ncbi:TadE/TadG family type IV pilus assembly protein [Consotaella aegiceratis]|uniref:TadE/TadG family type IV pilus assembly protein n=1 Tax=Consotaella aegiceratis TaxID=3097961 RepID=UPI002F3FF9E7
MSRLRRSVLPALASRSGVAAVEMALAAPMLLTMLCGTVEISRFVVAHYQAAQMATTVTDAIAREDTVNAELVDAIFDLSAQVMGKDDFSDNGYIILSSVALEEDQTDPTVEWQCSGGGDFTQMSAIGQVGQTATLPGNLTIDEDDDVIVAEVFYEYTPVLSWLPIEDTTIYKTAVFRPRLGALTTAPGC